MTLTDITTSSSNEVIEDFQDICLINDLGTDKLYIEAVTGELTYYYPGSTITATFNSVSLTCSDGAVFSYLTVYEDSTETQPSFIDITSETFSLNEANWLVNKTQTMRVNAFRNHDGTSKFRIRKDYDLTMYYCQISDIVLPALP